MRSRTAAAGVPAGVDPLLWTPRGLRRRCPRCRSSGCPTGRSSDYRSWSWSDRDERPMRPRAWVRLPSRRRLDLIAPTLFDWTDEDLAIGLSRAFRWGGHSAWPAPLSVAQRSLAALAPLAAETRGGAVPRHAPPPVLTIPAAGRAAPPSLGRRGHRRRCRARACITGAISWAAGFLRRRPARPRRSVCHGTVPKPSHRCRAAPLPRRRCERLSGHDPRRAA